MKTVKWGLFVLGVFFAITLILEIVNPSFRSHGENLAFAATAAILMWAGFFAIVRFERRSDPRLHGAGSAEPRCSSCGKKTQGRDALMAAQSYAVQAGLTQHARDLEKQQGYVCKSCGSLFCKSCLEGRVTSPQTGASCPRCGGSFGYLA